MPKLEAIIFDCDGTLVDSETLGVSVLVEVAAERGAALVGHDLLEELRGLKMAECVELLERRGGVRLREDFVPTARRRMADAFRRQLRPMEGARELLASLTVPLYVASSGPREKIELSLSVTGLAPLIRGRFVSSYDVGTWKPEPGIFLHAASVMGVAPHACGVVEDSEPGIIAGLAAGMRVFAYGEASSLVAQRRGVEHFRTHRELGEALRAAV